MRQVWKWSPQSPSHLPPTEQKERKSESVQKAKPEVEAGPSTTVAADQAPNEIAAAEEETVAAASEVRKDSVVIAKQEVEKDQATSKRKSTEGAASSELDDSDRRRVAANQPAIPAGRVSGISVAKVITGRVVSVDGLGLPGVNVMLKNTNIGTVTDGAGNYKLTTTEENPDLVFSFIGFTSAEVATGDKTQVDVQLDEDVSQLSEVVVVGYGSEKKDEEMETLELASPNGRPTRIQTIPRKEFAISRTSSCEWRGRKSYYSIHC
jgi:hypothetical protein